jgi:hypothetical protein
MRLCCYGIIAFLLARSVAFGDGCYIPERAVRKIPETRQRSNSAGSFPFRPCRAPSKRRRRVP